MRLFTGIVHRDEGSAYGITFPDVPGCFAAAEALTLRLEDQPIANPDKPNSAAQARKLSLPLVKLF